VTLQMPSVRRQTARRSSLPMTFTAHRLRVSHVVLYSGTMLRNASLSSYLTVGFEMGWAYSMYENAAKCMYSFRWKVSEGRGCMAAWHKLEDDMKVSLKYDVIMWTGIDCSILVGFCDFPGSIKYRVDLVSDCRRIDHARNPAVGWVRFIKL